MIVKATNNNLKELNSNLHGFAFSQNKEGIADITIGKEYVVYGTRKNDLGEFYWVLTDTINPNLPWWMPKGFYEVVDDKIPETWKVDVWESEAYGPEATRTNPVCFDYGEDIEDGTPKGREIFAIMKKEMDEFYSSREIGQEGL